MPNFLQNLDWTDIFVALIAGCSFIFFIFKFGIQKWIEKKFAESLERSKTDLIHEVEKQKLQINALLNRANKLHEKEFEILPIMWAKLNKTHDSILIIEYRYDEHPDFDRFSANQLEEFMEQSDFNFSNDEKTMMREATSKNLFYHKIQKNRLIFSAWTIYQDFRNYFICNGVFLHHDLKEMFKEVDTLLRELWVSSHVSERHSTPSLADDKYKEVGGKIKEMIENIELAIRGRLYPVVQENRKSLDTAN